jgi:hypothetical protein
VAAISRAAGHLEGTGTLQPVAAGTNVLVTAGVAQW